MARPKKDPKDKVGEAFTVRLPSEVTERVEVLRKELQQKAPFAKVTTADVLRHLITKASAAPTKLGIIPVAQGDKGKKSK